MIASPSRQSPPEGSPSEPLPSPAPRPRLGLPHLPAIDGLRGLAVIGVLLFHDGRLRGGYLGVDLFFVLSGYLITSLLLAEWAETGTLSLRDFWIRRARRLFPALLALLPAVALYAVTLAEPRELGRIRADGLATLAYVANWHTLAAGQSYWDLFSAPSPLAHTWSLSIEEQFYVVWPLLVLLVLRLARGSTRALLVVALCLALASALAMTALYVPESPSRAYEGTDTRGAGILVGAGLACALRARGLCCSHRAMWFLDLAGMVALIALGLAWGLVAWSSPFLYRGGLWLTEAAVVVLIACAAHGTPTRGALPSTARSSLIARALSFPPLVQVGLISYGLYLWHWPIFVVLTPHRLGAANFVATLARFAATVAVSLVSYRFLEQPIRKRGLTLTLGRPSFILPAAVSAAVLALLVSTRGIPPAALATDAGSFPAPGQLPVNTLKLLVLGDSVAQSIGERLHAAQTGRNAFVLERGIGDCSLLHDQLPTRSLNNRAHDGGDCDAHWMSDVAELHPDMTLVVLGGGFFAPVQVYGTWQHPCDDGFRRAYRTELRRNLESLRTDGGRIVLAIVPYPTGGFGENTPRANVDCFNETLRDSASDVPDIALLDLGGHLCPDGACTLKSHGDSIRPDGLHFSGVGADEIARWILATLNPTATL